MEKKVWNVPGVQEIDVRLTLGGGKESPNEKYYGDWDLGTLQQYPTEFGIYMAASAS